MTAYPVTRVTVKETPPPWASQKQVLGIIRDISPRREEPEDGLERIQNEDEPEVEAKVINPRRPRRPKPSEVAETK